MLSPLLCHCGAPAVNQTLLPNVKLAQVVGVHSLPPKATQLWISPTQMGLAYQAETGRLIRQPNVLRYQGATLQGSETPRGFLIKRLLSALKAAPARADFVIWADAQVPYRVIVEALFTAAQAEYSRFCFGVAGSTTLGVCIGSPKIHDTKRRVSFSNYGETLQITGINCHQKKGTPCTVPRSAQSAVVDIIAQIKKQDSSVKYSLGSRSKTPWQAHLQLTTELQSQVPNLIFMVPTDY